MPQIGRSLPRVDGTQKVTGVTRFAGDVQVSGMLHARLVLSPHPHARIVRVDATRAAAVPGVVGVFTGGDLPLANKRGGDRNAAPLAIDRVLFNGHPVVAVVAETERIADDAAALVRVDYEELTAVTDPLLARQPDAPRVRSAWSRSPRTSSACMAAIPARAQTAPRRPPRTWPAPCASHAAT